MKPDFHFKYLYGLKQWSDACESHYWWLQYYFSSSSLLYSISCFKSKSSPRGCLYFPSFVSSLLLSEREGGSNSHEVDRDRGVGCWQSAEAKKGCTVWPQTYKWCPLPPLYSVPLRLQNKSCALQPEIPLWSPGCLFLVFHWTRSTGGLSRGERLLNVMETSKTERSSWANCKREVGVMRPDLSQERVTDLYLHFQPLSSSPSLIFSSFFL